MGDHPEPLARRAGRWYGSQSQPVRLAAVAGVLALVGLVLYMVGSSLGGSGRGFAFAAVGVVVYFLPAVVASGREAPNQGSVWVVSLFFGWTVIGWVVALAMAVAGEAKDQPAPTDIPPVPLLR